MTESFILPFFILAGIGTLGFAIFSNKRYLETEPKKVLYKIPLTALASSLILSIFIEILFFIFPGHGDGAGMMSIVWVLWASAYIAVISVLSVIISVLMYFKNKNQISQTHEPIHHAKEGTKH